MKKAFRSLRAAALALAFVLCIVPAAPARAEGGALTGTVSPNASVLLFASCGGTELFAYTDGGTTRVSAADGSRSAATEYPGQYAFLRGGAVTIASSLDDFFAIQRFDADTLDETDFFPLEIRADDLYALEADGFGRLYAVLFSEPNEIFVYDAAGGYTGSLLFAEPVLGIQVLGERCTSFSKRRASASRWTRASRRPAPTYSPTPRTARTGCSTRKRTSTSRAGCAPWTAPCCLRPASTRPAS